MKSPFFYKATQFHSKLCIACFDDEIRNISPLFIHVVVKPALEAVLTAKEKKETLIFSKKISPNIIILNIVKTPDALQQFSS